MSDVLWTVWLVLWFAFAFAMSGYSCGQLSSMESGCRQSCGGTGQLVDDGRLCVCEDRLLRRDSAHWYVPVKEKP